MSPRIITARFKSIGRNVSVIQCCAPTNGDNEEAKEEFYNRLQNVLDETPRRDIQILMGDTNAKVGSYNTGREEILGKHGLETMNENGELFADFCTFNDLVIDAQSHMGLTRRENREPDRPHNHRQEMEKKSPGQTSKARSRCGIRPPSSTGNCENKVEEKS